jgi:hypothetical protein
MLEAFTIELVRKITVMAMIAEVEETAEKTKIALS